MYILNSSQFCSRPSCPFSLAQCKCHVTGISHQYGPGPSIFRVSESCLQTFVRSPRPNVRPISGRLSTRKSTNPDAHPCTERDVNSSLHFSSSTDSITLDGQATLSGRQGAHGIICGLFSGTRFVFIFCNIFIFIRLFLLSRLHVGQFSFFLLLAS